MVSTAHTSTMTAQEIGCAYDEITHLWTGKSFDRTNGIEQHKRALSFCDKPTQALDVGCGCTSRITELLLGSKIEVEGIDVSEKMLSLAKQRHPQLIFHCADVHSWEPQRTYDFITAWDSLWHLSHEHQIDVISKLSHHLSSGGVMIFSAGGAIEPEQHSNHSMGPELFYATLGVNGYQKLFLSLGLVCKHMEYEKPDDLHCYFIVQKP